MHVFLDTNIFETDPFWKNNYAKVLLKAAKDGIVKLYMSRVVVEELKNHTLRNYKKSIKDCNAAILHHNKFRPENILAAMAVDIEKEFQDFYDELQHVSNLKILEYKDQFYKIIMERALKKERPFHEGKQEFKDCTIWLTYANYVETKRISDCFLITNNHKDFFKKPALSESPTEYEVFDEFKRDTDRFRGYPSITDFLRKTLEPKIQASEQFKTWLSTITIDEEYVFELIYSDGAQKIESAIWSKASDLDVNDVFNNNEWHLTGYCDATNIEWINCEQVEVDILEDYCIVSCSVNFTVTIEGWQYNPVHDDMDEKYSYIGETDIETKASLSFYLKENDVVNSIDVDNIEFQFN
jgi:hypothetical protein